VISRKTRIDPETLIGFIILAAGVDIAIMFSKIPFWIGIILFIIGFILILHSLGWLALEKIISLVAQRFKEKKIENSIARKLIMKLLLNGRIISILFLLAVVIIMTVAIYNSYYSVNKEIGTYDLVLILLAIGLFIYPMIWRIFPREADFILCFLFALAIEIIPFITLMGSDNGFSDTGLGNLYIQYAIILPVIGLLNLSGIAAANSGSVIFFTTQDNVNASVGIAVSCSGIYSTMIFIAAFIAFALSYYEQWDRKLTYLLLIGILAAYIANILRIYLVILSGYFNGMGDPLDPSPFTLLWTHKYAGEIIFICWIALFWWLAFKYFAPDDRESNKEGKEEEAKLE